jgi:hypothetical protein
VQAFERTCDRTKELLSHGFQKDRRPNSACGECLANYKRVWFQEELAETKENGLSSDIKSSALYRFGVPVFIYIHKSRQDLSLASQLGSFFFLTMRITCMSSYFKNLRKCSKIAFDRISEKVILCLFWQENLTAACWHTMDPFRLSGRTGTANRVWKIANEATDSHCRRFPMEK